MLSVLPTSWQQQHGPARRRRCGNGAARVAVPVRAPARPPSVRRSGRPREALPASRSAPRPSPGGRERVTGAGGPRARPPAAGRLRSSSGPARAVRGARGWGEGPPGPGRRGQDPGSDGSAARSPGKRAGPPLARAPGRAPAGPTRLGWVAPRAPQLRVLARGSQGPNSTRGEAHRPGKSSAVRAAALCCSGGVWPRPGPCRRAAGECVVSGVPRVRPSSSLPHPPSSKCLFFFLFVPHFLFLVVSFQFTFVALICLLFGVLWVMAACGKHS